MSDPGRLVDTLLRVPFSISTLAGDPAPGIDWEIVWAEDGAGNTWVPVISEATDDNDDVIDGLYELGTTPSVTGWHHAWIVGIDPLGARRNVAFSERVVGTTSTVVLRPGDAVEFLVMATDADGNGIATDITIDAATNALGSTFTPAVAAVNGQTGAYLLTFTVPANDSSLGPWSIGLTIATDQPYRLVETWDVMESSGFDLVDVMTALSGVTVTLVSPIDPVDLRITIQRGSDYLYADGGALSWTVTSPSLAGATATFHLRTYAGASVISKAMTVASPTVRVDLTSTETAALSLGTPAYKYEITAVLSGGSTVTLVQGDCWTQD